MPSAVAAVAVAGEWGAEEEQLSLPPQPPSLAPPAVAAAAGAAEGGSKPQHQVLYEGWMEKRGAYTGTWRRRFLRLCDDGVLRYCGSDGACLCGMGLGMSVWRTWTNVVVLRDRLCTHTLTRSPSFLKHKTTQPNATHTRTAPPPLFPETPHHLDTTTIKHRHHPLPFPLTPAQPNATHTLALHRHHPPRRRPVGPHPPRRPRLPLFFKHKHKHTTRPAPPPFPFPFPLFLSPPPPTHSPQGTQRRGRGRVLH